MTDSPISPVTTSDPEDTEDEWWDDDAPTCLELTPWGLEMTKRCEVAYPDAANSVALRKAREAGWPGWPGENEDDR